MGRRGNSRCAPAPAPAHGRRPSDAVPLPVQIGSTSVFDEQGKPHGVAREQACNGGRVRRAREHNAKLMKQTWSTRRLISRRRRSVSSAVRPAQTTPNRRRDRVRTRHSQQSQQQRVIWRHARGLKRSLELAKPSKGRSTHRTVRERRRSVTAGADAPVRQHESSR